MPTTGQLGTLYSRLGGIVLGQGAAVVGPTFPVHVTTDVNVGFQLLGSAFPVSVTTEVAVESEPLLNFVPVFVTTEVLVISIAGPPGFPVSVVTQIQVESEPSLLFPVSVETEIEVSFNIEGGLQFVTTTVAVQSSLSGGPEGELANGRYRR